MNDVYDETEGRMQHVHVTKDCILVTLWYFARFDVRVRSIILLNLLTVEDD